MTCTPTGALVSDVPIDAFLGGSLEQVHFRDNVQVWHLQAEHGGGGIQDGGKEFRGIRQKDGLDEVNAEDVVPGSFVRLGKGANVVKVGVYFDLAYATPGAA